MRRLFPHEPSVSSPPQLLHPALQAALNNLDVQLETELTRYRRQRVGKAHRGRTKQRISPDVAAANRNRQPAEMIAIGAIGGRTQSLPASLSSESISTDRAEPLDTVDYDPWQPEGQSDSRPGAMALRATESFAPPRSSATLHNGSAIPKTPDALNLSSAAPETNTDAEVDDYFASSEELLRSLSEEEAELRSQQDPRLLESLLTPLGIGSLLLLLLSSVTVGYLILNPASFNALDRFLSRQNSVSTEPTGASEISSASPSSGSTSPDLSAEEFKDVNVGTLPTLPKTDSTVASLAPTVAPTAASEPVVGSTTDSGGISGIAEQRSSRVATVSPAPLTTPAQATTPRRSSQVASSARSINSSNRPTTPQRATQTEPSTQATRPSRPRRAAATPSSPTSTARSTARSRPSSDPDVATRSAQPPASGRYYYVIADYSGDRSLEQARQAVDDAYVRNFPNGARVQLGAFSDESRARELAQQLAQQGVSAQVYNP